MLITTSLYLLISNAVTTRRDKSILYSRVAIVILLSCLLLCINSFYLEFLGKGIGIYSGLLQATSLSHVFHAFIFIVTTIIIQINSFYPRKIWNKQYSSINKLLFYKLKYFNNLILNKMSEQFSIIEYSLIILFINIGGALLISSSDLITVFIAIELQSYGLYILCVMFRDSENATSGGLTYFLLGGLSSCFILLAFALIYANSGNTSFDGLYIINNISNEINANSVYNYNYFEISFVIMSVGFLFKIGAAPFHFWSPDVYDAIPTNVTIFVATFAKITILILILELIHYTNNSSVWPEETLNETTSLFYNLSWTFTLLISSFFSLIIGSIVGLTQYRIKRLYAYSTISHLGFILLALSVNTMESMQSFIFYIMQYSITNINAFILIIAIGYSLYLYIEKRERYINNSYINYELSDKNNSPIQLINQIKGYFHINPFLALSLGITLFSFVGIPPLIGFFAKQMVLSSALDQGYIFMVFVGIITSVISAYYYLALAKEMFFNKTDYILNPSLANMSLKAFITKKYSNKSSTITINTNDIVLSSYLSITISILTLITLLFIIMPQEWLNLATILALILFNN